MASELTIKDLMIELKKTRIEIKSSRESLKKLTDREKNIKEKASVFLKEKKQPGVKDKSEGIAIIIEKVQKTAHKKKDKIKEDVLTVLRNYMDDSKASKLFNELEQCKKGDKINEDVLKVINISN